MNNKKSDDEQELINVVTKFLTPVNLTGGQKDWIIETLIETLLHDPKEFIFLIKTPIKHAVFDDKATRKAVHSAIRSAVNSAMADNIIKEREAEQLKAEFLAEEKNNK